MARLRLLKSSAVYPQYIDAFYAARPALERRSFAEQIECLLQDGFGFGDSWKHYLESTGRFEVMEVVTNSMPAQRQWAKEKGVRTDTSTCCTKILAAQMSDFKPEVWFCHKPMLPEERLWLRRQCPSIRLVIGYDGALRHYPDHLAGCDIVLTCVRESAVFYTRAGLEGYWMPWGFDPRIVARLPSSRPRYDVSFCGSVNLRNGGHFGRLDLLDRIQRQFSLGAFVGGLDDRSLIRRVAGLAWHRQYDSAFRVLRDSPALRRLGSINQGERYGLSMHQVHAESKVALNKHGDAVKTAANMRLFEVTGVGTCLLTDWHDDLPEIFEPDREVVTYRSSEECAEKLQYLLEQDTARRSIAAAGRERCLRDHHLGNHIRAFAHERLQHV